METTYEFTAELWEYGGQAAWFFVTVPPEQSADIRSLPRAPKPGFGSIRVHVTLGQSTWSTSIFPDSKRGNYVLPVKKSIRAREGVAAGDPLELIIELAEG